MESFGEKYRHELKYIVDEREIRLVISRIKEIMKTDKYHPEGKYRIRSIYFDDIWDSALRQNIEGISPRSKYRIRIYNEDKSCIHLEQKIKNNDLTKKKSCFLSIDECEQLMRGKLNRILPGEDRKVLINLRLKMLRDCFRPRMIVEYERTAFTYKDGNVRVTFDKNLAASQYIERLWAKELPKRPIISEGQCIMEVKYDEFIPNYIKHALNTGKMERVAFSKYTLCRLYERSGKNSECE